MSLRLRVVAGDQHRGSNPSVAALGRCLRRPLCCCAVMITQGSLIQRNALDGTRHPVAVGSALRRLAAVGQAAYPDELAAACGSCYLGEKCAAMPPKSEERGEGGAR